MSNETAYDFNWLLKPTKSGIQNDTIAPFLWSLINPSCLFANQSHICVTSRKAAATRGSSGGSYFFPASNLRKSRPSNRTFSFGNIIICSFLFCFFHKIEFSFFLNSKIALIHIKLPKHRKYLQINDYHNRLIKWHYYYK